MSPLLAAALLMFTGLAIVIASAVYARFNYVKFVNSEKEIINNLVTLVNTRNLAVNKALQEHIVWLVDEFNGNCIEIFMSDTYLLALKDKYNISDTEFVMSFQNVISDVQNINRIKTQELMSKVSNSMVNAVKDQIGVK